MVRCKGDENPKTGYVPGQIEMHRQFFCGDVWEENDFRGNLSMHVSKYEGRRGPIKLTWTCSKWASGGRKVPVGDRMSGTLDL